MSKRHYAGVLLVLATAPAFGQTSVSVEDRAPFFSDPQARIECPPGTARRTASIRYRDLYPALDMASPSDAAYRPANLIEPPRVVFPAQLQALGVTGFVSVAFLIAEDGSVGDAKVLCSSAPAFEQAALESLVGMRYKPATRNGERIAAPGIQPFDFQLAD